MQVITVAQSPSILFIVMTKRIIFIAGIHGVGKTFLCSKLSTDTGINHYSASELIKRTSKDQQADHTEKRVANVDKNQDILIRTIEQYLCDETVFLLDGHFCLLSKNSTAEPIPTEIFQQLSPVGILLMHSPIKTVIERLSNRDGKTYDPNTLSELQECELQHGRLIAQQLNTPCLEFADGDSYQMALHFLNGILKGTGDENPARH